jgi:LuxR family maltose regulon positive regulatory protein
LLDGLDQGEQARLTLVVASAGAGKTALLADWVATRPERRPAWLSCDAADADAARFVAAIIEALRRAAGQPDLGEDARQLLSLDGEVSADVIAALADDLERPEAPEVLIVDDFHLTGGAGIDVLSLLLEYRPPGLQIVVASRVDPSLRLHRMRANQELVEVRESDLSFSDAETRLFLSRFGVQLDERGLGQVQRRSEGWAAGLQMAALSIRQASGPSKVTERVELERHTVAGYFLDEVLYRQPAPVVEFMLATSILDELSPSACAALCGQGASELLVQIYRDHLFVNLVDDETGTCRYHQLIRDVLRAELRARDLQTKRQMHERAANYLAGIGRIGPAARHLLDAGDPTTAFRLLSEGVIVDFASDPTPGSTLSDIQPDDFAGAPEILVPLAAELLLRGAFEPGARAFALAQLTMIDAQQQPELALKFAAVSCSYHELIGEMDRGLEERDRARHMAAQTAGVEEWLVGVDGMAMYCHLYLGNFTEALAMADAVEASELTPPPAREVLCTGIRSQVAWAQGSLAEAGARATRALAAADRLGFDRHFFAFNSLRTQALLALEHGDLVTAIDVTEHILGTVVGGRPVFDYLAQLDRARIWAAAGNLDEALASLPAARTALRSRHSVLLAQADELEARIRLALGDLAGANDMAQRLADDRRIVTSAMIAVRAGDTKRASKLLPELPARPPTVRSLVEAQLLRADIALLLHSAQAPRLVREAVQVVDRHGFLQTVLDTSPLLLDHLISGSERYPRTEHLGALLAAAMRARQRGATGPQAGHLADPLTDAEVKVLRKLPQPLTYSDIADDMHLSLNTVKTHLRHTYMKLGVTSRSAAIKRAAALGFV